jgi:hypothetical protein
VELCRYPSRRRYLLDHRHQFSVSLVHADLRLRGRMQIFLKTAAPRPSTPTLHLHGGIQIFVKTVCSPPWPSNPALHLCVMACRRSSLRSNADLRQEGCLSAIPLCLSTINTKSITLHLRSGMQIFVKTAAASRPSTRTLHLRVAHRSSSRLFPLRIGHRLQLSIFV